MAESLEKALADEEFRAVRDMLRDDGHWRRLVEVDVVTYSAGAELSDWQLQGAEAAARAPAPAYRSPSRGELAARILLIVIFAAAVVALAWAGRGGL